MPIDGHGHGISLGGNQVANLASGEIVEDLKLGLELAAVGKPPLFCQLHVSLARFPCRLRGQRAS